jgi:hypothetical protein
MKPRRSSLFTRVIGKCLLRVATAVLAGTAMSLTIAQEAGSPPRVGGRKTSEEPRPSTGTLPSADSKPSADSQTDPKTDSGPKPLTGPKDPEAKKEGPRSREIKKAEPKGTPTSGGKGTSGRRGPPNLEARLVEGGTLNLALLDERVEFITPYGRLSVPLTDVKRMEFATRAWRRKAG